MECTTCNLCGQGTFASASEVASVPCNVREFADDHFTVWRCSGCGSLHCKESADLPRYYAGYPFKRHTLDFHTTVAYRNRLRLLARHGVTRASSMLDFGCGTGVFVEFLRARGFENVCGYDSFVEQYADRSVLDRRFDVVTSYDVIEHVDDPKAYVRTLASLVSPGGLLVVGTPNADNIPLTATTHVPFELHQPYHRHILSEGMLRKVTAECGLDVLHASHRFYFDSLYPTVNARFIWEHVYAAGGMLDVCVEPPRLDIIMRSPKLLFYALFGYFFPPRGSVLLTLKKASS